MLRSFLSKPSLRGLGLAGAALLCAAALPVRPLGSTDVQGPTAGLQDPPARDLAVHCGILHLGDGRVMTDCYLVVRDGRVQSILQDQSPPSDLPIVDASDKVVMPGLVAADTDLSAVPDDDYTITPDLVALDTFDFDREWPTALEGGVTTVYLSPGRNRFVSGQGSVVKVAGRDLLQRVLSETNCLRITLDDRANAAPPVFEPVISPTSDNPLEPARRQYPSSRISQLSELRRSFQDALRDDSEEFVGTGSIETRYASETLRRAARGDLPLRISAQEAQDIRRALLFADQLGQTESLVIEDLVELAPVASRLAAAKVAAVLRIPIRLSSSNAGGENRLDDSKRRQPETPAQAEAAGIDVALAPIRNDDLQDLLMIAALAVRHGMSESGALRAVTSTSAEILGVGDRVGSLTPGHDADFLVLSGEPLAIGTMVEQTWIDGRREYLRRTDSNILAIKAGMILTGDGETIRDGMVLVSGGKIRGIGSSLSAPYGAEVIDLGPDAVITPGFVDANSQLGLSGDGTVVPPGSPDQQIGAVVRHDDPIFQAALRGGVTTVLSSGQDANLISGRMAAIKTGAPDDKSAVLRDIVGLRYVFDAFGENATKPIADQISAGRKYLETWQAYEKALREWESGASEEESKPEEEPAEAEKPAEKPEEAEKPDPVSGTWECKLEIPTPFEVKLILVITLDGEQVSGTVTVSAGPLPEETNDVSGTYKDGQLLLNVETPVGNGEFTATIEGDKLTGTVKAQGNAIPVSGTRTSRSTEAPKPSRRRPKKDDSEPDDKPKAPEVNEGLEPIRAILDGRATAVIRCSRAPAILSIVELFRREKIRFVLHGAEDALETPELLGDDAPPLMIGPELVHREKGEVINDAARASDLTEAVALVTGDTAGSRYLPLHTAHAVRYGMDPTAALRSITIDPAKMFGIDDAVGSIARGKHADLVVFDGSPFELTSRVLMVVCNGRIALDAREEAN